MAQEYLPQRDAAVLTGQDNLQNYDEYNDNFPQNGNLSDVYFNENEDIHGQPLVYSEAVAQNVAVLALVLLVGLILNLVAVPVILFRRTRFGNGLFAVLILCLTLSDVAVLLLSVLGSLVMEIGHLLWGGAPGSCQIYYWLSAWVTGLSAYLLVALVGMVTAKAASPDSCLVRIRDCRWLLLAMLAASGLYALPELLVRDSLELGDGGGSVCILGVTGVEYAAYVAWRLALRHLLPAILVIAATLRPETRISKRVSHLFFGHLGEPCCCGEEGRPLKFPHECPTMRTAMLKNANSSSPAIVPSTVLINNSSPVRPPRNSGKNGHSLNRLRPDLVPSDASSTSLGANNDPEVIGFGRPIITSNSNSNGSNVLRSSRRRQHLDNRKVVSAQSEDPHRRRYKLALAITFVLATIINFAMDVTFQIQSAETNTWFPDAVQNATEPLSVGITVVGDNNNNTMENSSNLYSSTGDSSLTYIENLATAVYALAHLQQLLDPIVFLIAEFWF